MKMTMENPMAYLEIAIEIKNLSPFASRSDALVPILLLRVVFVIPSSFPPRCDDGYLERAGDNSIWSVHSCRRFRATTFELLPSASTRGRALRIKNLSASFASLVCREL